MTHTVVYFEKETIDNKIADVIKGIKDAYYEAFSLDYSATSVVVHELDEDEISESMRNSIILLVYTALGKGNEVKKRCYEALYNKINNALGTENCKNIEIIIKEQANDMTGENGIMRADDVVASTVYEK